MLSTCVYVRVLSTNGSRTLRSRISNLAQAMQGRGGGAIPAGFHLLNTGPPPEYLSPNVACPVRTKRYGPYMVKNMRIELRVDEDERELWKAEAAKDGLSISAWLRQLARVETEFAPKVPEREEAERPLDPMCVERQEDRAAALSGGGAAEDASEHWSGVVDAESESLPSAGSYPTGPVDPAQLTKLIKQLEAQGNPDAEEVARKRLGM